MFPSRLTEALVVAAVLGPLSHYAVWMRWELDGSFYRLIPVFLLLQPLSLLSLYYLTDTSIIESVILLWLLQSIYFITLFASIAIYRLFFHSTHIYPGPFWARLWSWWKIKAFLDRDEQGYKVIEDLHAKYGDVVRIGPRQLSINHVDAIADIYGTNSKCSRGAQSELGKMQDLQSLRDKEYHKHRRNMWELGLNGKACQQYLPRINRVTDLCIDKLLAYNGEPVVINDWMHFLTFDIMGEMGFSRTYGQLEEGKLHPAIGQIHKFLQFGISAIQVTWLANVGPYVPGVEDPITAFVKFCDQWLKLREENEPEDVDIMSFIIRGKDSKSRWPISRTALVHDCSTMQIAGSDTSYSALVYLVYYIAKDPTLQSQLRDEVSHTVDAEGMPDWPKLQGCTLLDSVITEALRMHPPVPQGLTRETPYYSGARLGPYAVPRETMVSVPTWSIQHDERYFARPLEWIPARWTSEPHLVKDRRAWIPFSTGPTVCVGKYFAMMEMKLFVARVLMAFDVQFAPGEDGRQVIEGNKDFFTTWLPDLRMCLIPRGR